MDEISIYLARANPVTEDENIEYPHGKWYKCPLNEEMIREELGASSTEALVVLDHEAPFPIHAEDSISQINHLFNAYDSIADIHVRRAVTDLLDNFFEDIVELAEHQDDLIVYPETNLADLAEELVEEGILFGPLPDSIFFYLDYHAIARDLEINGSYLETSHAVFEYPY